MRWLIDFLQGTKIIKLIHDTLIYGYKNRVNAFKFGLNNESPAWDDTLLTVDFNLRTQEDMHSYQVPNIGTALLRDESVVLAGLCRGVARRVSIHGLKPTVNKISSLRDLYLKKY